MKTPRWKLLTNDAFSAWFGNSILREDDENGYPVPRVMYHGTLAEEPFTVFRLPETELGIHVGTIEQATEFAEITPANYHGGNFKSRPRIYPLYVRLEHPIHLRDRGDWTPKSIISGLEEYGVISSQLFDKIFDEYGRINALKEARLIDRDAANDLRHDIHVKYIPLLREKLTEAGYDGAVYHNDIEGIKGADRKSYIVWNPAQLKSALGNRGTWDFNNPDILQGFGGLHRK